MNMSNMHLPHRNVILVKEKKSSKFLPGVLFGVILTVALKAKKDMADEQKREEWKARISDATKKAEEFRGVVKDKVSDATDAVQEKVDEKRDALSDTISSDDNSQSTSVDSANADEATPAAMPKKSAAKSSAKA